MLSVALIGTQLRVLCSEEVADVAELRHALAGADPQASIEPVAPNLEDVFVLLTGETIE